MLVGFTLGSVTKNEKFHCYSPMGSLICYVVSFAFFFLAIFYVQRHTDRIAAWEGRGGDTQQIFIRRRPTP